MGFLIRVYIEIKSQGLKENIWFAARNICNDKAPANFAKIFHTQVKVKFFSWLIYNQKNTFIRNKDILQESHDMLVQEFVDSVL